MQSPGKELATGQRMIHKLKSLVRVARASSRSLPPTGGREESSNPPDEPPTTGQDPPEASHHSRFPSSESASSDDTLVASDSSVPKAQIEKSVSEARTRCRKALLIGIQYLGSDKDKLAGPHKDVRDMKQALLELYHYDERDITILIDNGDSGQLQPTRKNMIAQIQKLVSDGQPGDTFFFHYAGHSKQVDNRDNSEEDGKDECLVPLDGSQTSEFLIKDNDLRKYLVDNLPSGCTLVFSIHAILVPFSTLNIIVAIVFIPPGFLKEGGNRLLSGIVSVSLSAAQDDQKSWEDRKGASMTQAFSSCPLLKAMLIRVIEEDRTPTFRKLLSRVSHELHHSYIQLHDDARAYKKDYNDRVAKAIRNNRPVRERQEVEMDNFQDPQLSSLVPLLAPRPLPLVGIYSVYNHTPSAARQTVLYVLSCILRIYSKLKSLVRVARASSRSLPPTGGREESSNPPDEPPTTGQDPPEASHHSRFPSSESASSDDTLVASDSSVPKAQIEKSVSEARTRCRKALLIGIQYLGSDKDKLAGPHKDVRDMKQALLELYHYDERDITILIDNGDSGQLQPTRKNMIAQIQKLVSDGQPGDTFFFHYAGHSKQVDNRDNSEEDGKDECLVPLDGSQTSEFLIKDNDLRKYLVDNLPSGCTLVAVFDTCHSGSLLDLEHYRCNRVYTPWVSKGRRKSASKWNCIVRRGCICSPSDRAAPSPIFGENVEARQILQRRQFNSAHAPSKRRWSREQVLSSVPEKQNASLPLTISTNVERQSFILQSPERRMSSPEPIWPCTGFCRDDRRSRNLMTDNRLVVSLSAAQDDQKSWEDRKGASMTQAFSSCPLLKAMLIRVIEEDRTPTFRKLLSRVSHELHHSYIQLHDDARAYKKDYNDRVAKAIRNNRPVRERQEVEMDNFQDPQLSSLVPLNMEERLRL
ncbi:Metacaspase-1 [Leucoagaricus sp. SymC.cos]|nr:Metacaspase-1 [Leucoagaricus sp. SymC.cos]